MNQFTVIEGSSPTRRGKGEGTKANPSLELETLVRGLKHKMSPPS